MSNAARRDKDAAPQQPDLFEWVAQHGGYPNIPWSQWDQAVDDAKIKYCATVQKESDDYARRHPGKRPTKASLKPARPWAVPELEAHTKRKRGKR